MYTKEEWEQLQELAELLGDDESLGLTQRLIVNNVIQSCKDRGVSFEQQVKDFVNEGLKAPH